MGNSLFQSESIQKAYFSLSIPVVLSMVVTIIYNVTDTYFIALTGNTDLIAGVSLCAPAFTLLMGFGNIFGQGGSSLISRLLGQNDTENLHRVSSFCFWTAILFGFAAAGFMLGLRDPILHLLGADAVTAVHASAYYSWFAAGAPIVVLSFIHTNLLRAEGFARESMIGTISGSVVNIILDPVFIFTLKMGAAGAAIATVIGYLCTDLYSLFIVLKKSKVLSVDIHKWKISPHFISQILAIGTSAALSNITQSFCLILTNQALLPYGNDKIAAMGIVQKVSMIVMLVIVGFSFGGAPLIGYTYGAGNKERMKKLLSFILRFLMLTALGMSIFMILFAKPAVHLFLEEPVLIRTAEMMLRAQMSSMVFMAVVLFITVFFQSVGSAGPALVLSLSRQGFVFAIVLFAAVRIAGYSGIIWTQAVSDLFSAALALILFARARK